MLRLALPMLSCAALLWCASDKTPAPRARCPATPDVFVEPEEARGRAPEPQAPGRPGAPEAHEPAELRQHDVRDLVATGCDVESLARMVGSEGIRVSPIVNVLEIMAPAGKQLEIEQVLDERRRSKPKRVLQFYDVKDLCWDAMLTDEAAPDVDAFLPIEIDSLIEVIEATIGIGAAEIQAKNRVLVVRAEPAVHAAIAQYLKELRSNVEAAASKPPRNP